MTDDPREVLKAAGVECAEVDDYMAVLETEACPECGQFFFDTEQDFDAIRALALLVAQYKWQRDECADELGRKLAIGYKYEATKPFAASDVIVDLNRRWDERNA